MLNDLIRHFETVTVLSSSFKRVSSRQTPLFVSNKPSQLPPGLLFFGGQYMDKIALCVQNWSIMAICEILRYTCISFSCSFNMFLINCHIEKEQDIISSQPVNRGCIVTKARIFTEKQRKSILNNRRKTKTKTREKKKLHKYY